MKILYSYRTEEERDYVAKTLSEYEVIFHDGSLQNGDWNGKDVEILSIFVNSTVGKEEFEKLPDLKFIAGRSTGYDHIDLKLAKEKGVVVSNVPAYGEHTVAEFAFALLLTISRKIPEATNRVREENSFNPNGLAGFDLSEKTIGILGTGKIGKNAIKIAKGFGMKVLAFDMYPDKKFAEEMNYEYVELDELLEKSDILSLHLPENDDTHKILNKEKFEKTKPGTVLINTARGSLIDSEALLWALDENIISFAGLDVLSEEADIFNDHPNNQKEAELNQKLIQHPNVLITPHVGFNTKEASQRIIDTSLENIEKFVSGEPQNIVSG